MLPLFLLAFLRTGMRWRECEQDRDRVCFSYPSYLRYETWQGLDLHWLALVPGGMADTLPDSITPFPDRTRRLPAALRYLIACGSVAALWWVVGIWWERLHSGRRLQPRQRRLRRTILLLTGLLTPWFVLQIYLGMRGGYEGPL